ncbi:hypothetical protein Nmel_010150, partial [Mimus melanotis]
MSSLSAVPRAGRAPGGAARAGPSGRVPRDPRGGIPLCPFPALPAPLPAGPSGPLGTPRPSPNQICAWVAGGNGRSVVETRASSRWLRIHRDVLALSYFHGFIPHSQTLLDNALGLVLHWETHPEPAGSIPSASVSIKGKHLRCSSRAVLEKIPLSSRQTTSTGVRT